MSKEKTGYPSLDKPWLKYFKEDAEEIATKIPENKTVWDIIEKSLYDYMDVPAIEYFGNSISRKELIDDVYIWAKAFKAMGIKENEIVPYYGPFLPDTCSMILALNMIGACPYFLKLAISEQALKEETQEAKVAIVFDEMWPKVSCEFSKDKFKKVIFIKSTDSMPVSKKIFLSLLNKSKTPKGEKYISLKAAKSKAVDQRGLEKSNYVKNRSTFITSSSGTTVGGLVKGTVATNESVLSQIYTNKAAEVIFTPREKTLNHFPPTASTSLNVLFLLPLFHGNTIVMDPRISEEDFYYQIIKLKPNVAVHTGSAWETFFNKVENKMKKGEKFDFSYAKFWIIGGEGTDIKKFKKWNEIMKQNNAPSLLYNGYGSSEVFSSATIETEKARQNFSKSIMSVGIPYPGMNVGIFDKDGNELPYNCRGEVRFKSNSTMKEYYGKPELTKKTIEENWVHMGDMGEIDEDGFVYIYGRLNDKIEKDNGKEIFLFDIENLIKGNEYVDDAIVLPYELDCHKNGLVAHIVFDNNISSAAKEEILKKLNKQIEESDFDVVIDGYAEHEIMLPYSPTTLKKDKNKLSQQKEGYMQIIDGRLQEVTLK